jgi:hypothetical protein
LENNLIHQPNSNDQQAELMNNGQQKVKEQEEKLNQQQYELSQKQHQQQKRHKEMDPLQLPPLPPIPQHQQQRHIVPQQQQQQPIQNVQSYHRLSNDQFNDFFNLYNQPLVDQNGLNTETNNNNYMNQQFGQVKQNNLKEKFAKESSPPNQASFYQQQNYKPKENSFYNPHLKSNNNNNNNNKKKIIPKPSILEENNADIEKYFKNAASVVGGIIEQTGGSPIHSIKTFPSLSPTMPSLESSIKDDNNERSKQTGSVSGPVSLSYPSSAIPITIPPKPIEKQAPPTINKLTTKLPQYQQRPNNNNNNNNEPPMRKNENNNNAMMPPSKTKFNKIIIDKNNNKPGQINNTNSPNLELIENDYRYQAQNKGPKNFDDRIPFGSMNMAQQVKF